MCATLNPAITRSSSAGSDSSSDLRRTNGAMMAIPFSVLSVSWDCVPSPVHRDASATHSPEDRLVFLGRAVEVGGARLATKEYRWRALGARGDRSEIHAGISERNGDGSRTYWTFLDKPAYFWSA